MSDFVVEIYLKVATPNMDVLEFEVGFHAEVILVQVVNSSSHRLWDLVDVEGASCSRLIAIRVLTEGVACGDMLSENRR